MSLLDVVILQIFLRQSIIRDRGRSSSACRPITWDFSVRSKPDRWQNQWAPGRGSHRAGHPHPCGAVQQCQPHPGADEHRDTCQCLCRCGGLPGADGAARNIGWFHSRSVYLPVRRTHPWTKVCVLQ